MIMADGEVRALVDWRRGRKDEMPFITPWRLVERILSKYEGSVHVPLRPVPALRARMERVSDGSG
jgi:hypothetical protein